MAIRLISKDELISTKQKILQTSLVFFVPLLGALLVIFVNKAKPSSTGKYSESTNFENFEGNLRIRNKNELEFDVDDD